MSEEIKTENHINEKRCDPSILIEDYHKKHEIPVRKDPMTEEERKGAAEYYQKIMEEAKK